MVGEIYIVADGIVVADGVTVAGGVAGKKGVMTKATCWARAASDGMGKALCRVGIAVARVTIVGAKMPVVVDCNKLGDKLGGKIVGNDTWLGSALAPQLVQIHRIKVKTEIRQTKSLYNILCIKYC